MYEILFDVLLVIILGFTAMAAWSRDLLKSVIFLSAASVSTAIVFFLMHAPDIAITKVAVEAGVATAVFVVTIQKTARFEKGKNEMISGKSPEQNPGKG